MSGAKSKNVLAVPPDGGWGWVIVVASFICNAFVDGMCGVFGVFLPNFLYYFGESQGKTVIAGSLAAGGFMCSGPLASALIHTVGCRVVSMAGGLVATTAFVLATFSPNVDVLIITYGLMGGLGLGLMYLPANVMVGYYFERRRALAAGIASSGAGFGVLALAPLSGLLLKLYNWQNAMLLIAGCVLHSVVCGALMRPLVTSRPCSDSNKDNDDTWEEEYCKEEPDVGKTLQSMSSLQKLSLHSEKEPRFSLHRNVLENLKRKPPETHYTSQEFKLSNNARYEETYASPKFVNSMGIKQPEFRSCLDLPVNTKHTGSSETDPFIRESLTHEPMSSASPYKSPHIFSSCHELTSSRCPNKAVPSLCHENNDRDDGGKSWTRSVSKMDISFAGSTIALSNLSIHNQSMLTLESGTSPKYGQCGRFLSRLRHVIRTTFDLSAVQSPHFLIICFGSIFIQIGYFIPVTFLSSYAISLDIDTGKAALLLSVIGISNTIGRAAAGGLANLPKVDPLHLNNISLLIAGVASVLCGFVCKTFLALVLYAAVFGLFIASFVPLTTVFLVDYLGLEKLTSAYGLLSMVRGIASMTGAPIAGMLMDATDSYMATFCFAGSMFIVAGLIHYLLPLASRLKRGPPQCNTLTK